MQLFREKTISKHDFLMIEKFALIFLSLPKEKSNSNDLITSLPVI